MDAGDQRRRRSQRHGYQQGFNDDNSQSFRAPSSAGGARSSSSAAIGPTEGTQQGHAVPTFGSLQQVGGYGHAPSQHYPSQPTFGPAYTYPPDYSQNPAQRGLPYSQNPQQMMYSNVSSLPQAPGTSLLPFNEPTSFQQRPSTAVERLSHQLGEVQYYNPSESHAPLASDPYQPGSMHQNLPYTSSAGFDQPQLVSGQASEDQNLQHMVRMRQPQQQVPLDPLTLHYQLLRQANTFTSQGRLVEARPLLIRLSTNLVDHVVTLGLNQDRASGGRSAARERLDFWEDFNNCWLALLQRQLDDSRAMSPADTRPAPNLLSTELLEELGNDVIRMGDGLEQYGLVDYQVGLWEKEILSLVELCIDALGGNRPPTAARTAPFSRGAP